MWKIDRIVAVPIELDFTSSGQGLKSATAVESDGTLLINALELVEFDPEATQVHVCEACGYTRCSSGDWVMMRRVGSSVVWLPAWSETETGDFARQEFGPPTFLAERGAPCFTEQAWSELSRLNRNVPRSRRLRPLSGREASRLVQWFAPGRVLGEYPVEPKLRREALIAVSDGDLLAEANAVDDALRHLFADTSPVEVVTPALGLTPIEFHLDLPGMPAWAPLGHWRDTICLLVGGGSTLIRQAG